MPIQAASTCGIVGFSISSLLCCQQVKFKQEKTVQHNTMSPRHIVFLEIIEIEHGEWKYTYRPVDPVRPNSYLFGIECFVYSHLSQLFTFFGLTEHGSINMHLIA